MTDKDFPRHNLSPWGEHAHELTVESDGWSHDWAEASEALLTALTCAVLDLSDAVRSLGRQPSNAAAVLDAAPTAEALAVLMRGVQSEQATDRAGSEQP